MESEGAASATAAAAEIPITSTGATGIEFDEPTDSAEDNKLVIFEVVLKGGAPWGFSLKGGSEQRCPITIAKIEPGGKAYQSGNLQCDDQILAVNEVQCDSHHEAIQLVKSAFNTLHLSVIRGSPNDYKHGLKSADYYHSSAHIYSSKDMHPQHGQQDMLPEPTKTAPPGGEREDSRNEIQPTHQDQSRGIMQKLANIGRNKNLTNSSSSHNQ
ncbi:protein Shroom3-like [Amphiura filiformis]|uniref:protein Shroom3-like n=1 Tax=Amphiura filiformis TaxID=82378 RepID=UPI003B210F39